MGEEQRVPSLRCGMTNKRAGNGKSKDNGKSWLVEDLHSHLSDDKTVAKMGHPFVWAWWGRTGRCNAAAGCNSRSDQGRWPWVVGEMGVTAGVAMPRNSVTEL